MNVYILAHLGPFEHISLGEMQDQAMVPDFQVSHFFNTLQQKRNNNKQIQ